MIKTEAEVPAIMRQSRQLAESGAWDEAIELLTEANRQVEDGRLETRLVRYRHIAFDELQLPQPSAHWSQPVPDHFADTKLVPEVQAADLSVEVVRSAIKHHGSLIVRGLFKSDACKVMRDSIDEAFAASEAVAGQKEFEPTPWFTHFVQQRRLGYVFGGAERYFVTFGAGVLAVDSPRALFRFIECLKDAGFDRFLHDYFGERPALSAKKSTLRRTPPDAKAGWHQDGGYFRAEVRALNLWAAFSPCGKDAPSIDMFTIPFDHIVKQGGPGIDDTAVAIETAESYGKENIQRLQFEEGDGLLFDEMALHQTGADASMTQTRYAMEMWFFASSMFPREQVPLYL